MNATILTIACLLQFAAALAALRLYRMVGRNLAWILMAMAAALLGLRHAVALVQIVSGDAQNPAELTTATVALLIAGLMFVGIARLRPARESLSDQKPAISQHEMSLQSGAKPERMFATSLDLMCVATLEGYFQRVNPAFESLLGWSIEELEGHRFLDFIHPDDREATLLELDHLGEQQNTIGFVNRYRCRDNSYRWLSWTCPAPSESGDNLLFATAREVTGQRRMEVAMEAANAELEAFCYSMSHDLRAPLRHIDGFSAAVLEDYGDQLDDAGREMLEMTREAAKKIDTLIDNLLSLSRITRWEMNATTVDLSAMAAEICNELSSLAPERTVEFRIEEGIQRIADAKLIRIAILNLLQNAWTYSERTEQAVIEFGQISDDTYHPVLFVRDNGVGFNPEYADKVFAPFRRLHRQTEFPGAGVGLAMVQRVVGRHGGRVWGESQVGRGATFSFTLGNTADEWQLQAGITPAPPDEDD